MTIVSVTARKRSARSNLGLKFEILPNDRVIIKYLSPGGIGGDGILRPGREIKSVNGVDARAHVKKFGAHHFQPFLDGLPQGKVVIDVETCPVVPSVDLVDGVVQHIKFLRALHRNGIMLTKPNGETLRRYVDLWLPFVAKMRAADPGCELVPPGDVAWVWHCHRLAPYRYLEYVHERFFGKRLAKISTTCGSKQLAEELLTHQCLDASHPFAFQLRDNERNCTLDESEQLLEVCNKTVELFNEMYPDESFFLSDGKSSENHCETSSRLGGFDLIESCERQSSFLWQVSHPNYSLRSFLDQGSENYSKFVRLMPIKEHKYIVPTFQIDLLWHTHIASSVYRYHADNMEANGMIMDHDDTLNDRTEGGDLETNFKATRRLWYTAHGEEYCVQGGMYRGNRPGSTIDRTGRMRTSTM